MLQNMFLFMAGEFFYLNGLLLLLLFCIFYLKNPNYLQGEVAINLSLPLLVLLSIFYFFCLPCDASNISTVNLFYIYFRLILLIFFVLFLFSLTKFNYFNKLAGYEFVILFLLCFMGFCFIITSDNLFLMFLALELQNLCLYILTGMRRQKWFSVESGFRYFIMGAFSSALFVFGLSILYGVFGTLDLLELHFLIKNLELNDMLVLLGFFFLIVSVFFKTGLAPFHWWIPDVYEGAPRSVSFFISIFPKFVYVLLMVKIHLYFSEVLLYFTYLVVYFVLSSLIFGYLGSLFQYNILRFIAYSGVFNSSFFYITLFSPYTLESVSSCLLFVLIYIITLKAVFILLEHVREKKTYTSLRFLFDLNTLYYSNFVLFLVLIFFLFSFIGLPPLMGFFGKFFVLEFLLMQNQYMLFFILFFASVAASYYYVRIIRLSTLSYGYSYMYLDSITPRVSYLVAVLFVLNVLFFLFLDIIYLLIFVFYA